MSVVYFVQAGKDGPIKIGFATDLRQRVSDLATACPGPPVVLASICGSMAFEKRIHRHLKKARRYREWFNPTEEVRALVALAEAGDVDTIREKLHESEAREEASAASHETLKPLISIGLAFGAEMIAQRYGATAAAHAAGISDDTLLKVRQRKRGLGVTGYIQLRALHPQAFSLLDLLGNVDPSDAKSLEQAREAIDELLKKLTVRAA